MTSGVTRVGPGGAQPYHRAFEPYHPHFYVFKFEIKIDEIRQTDMHSSTILFILKLRLIYCHILASAMDDSDIFLKTILLCIKSTDLHRSSLPFSCPNLKLFKRISIIVVKSSSKQNTITSFFSPSAAKRQKVTAEESTLSIISSEDEEVASCEASSLVSATDPNLNSNVDLITTYN